MIAEHSDWIFAGVFFDAGKSGLRRKGRTELDKMLKKAAKGKIDYIITKSIEGIKRYCGNIKDSKIFKRKGY